MEADARKINDLDNQHGGSCEELIRELVFKRGVVRSSIWERLKYKDRLIRQTSKINWLREGGHSTRYFHTMLKNITTKNAIVSLKTSSGLVESVEGIKEEINNYFENKFKETDCKNQF